MRNISIEVGTEFMSGEGFLTAIKRRCLVGRKAEEVLLEPTFKVSNKKRIVKLVIASMQELGFGEKARIEDIYERAKKAGLGPCADEIAPLFRLKYEKQPKGELLVVAIDPPTDSNGNLRLFEIIRTESGEQWITVLGGDHKSYLESKVLWVFVKK